MQGDINLSLLLDPVNSKLSAEWVTKNKGLFAGCYFMMWLFEEEGFWVTFFLSCTAVTNNF